HRQRVVLALFLLACSCFGLSGYLAVSLPAPSVRPTPGQIDNAFEASGPAEIMQAYEELQKGLQPAPIIVGSPEDHRGGMLWAIKIALGLGAASSIAAIGLLLSGRN